MTQNQQQRPQQAGVFYSEDRSAIRWPYYLNLVFWPLLLVVAIACTGVVGTTLWAWLMALATFGTVLSLAFALQSWPVGIRMSGDGIRIGAVRRRPNPAGKQPWSDYQRWQELFAPWGAVRRVAVIADKPGLRDARMLGKRDVNRIGVLTAPFARAVLLIEIDPGRVSVPDFHEPHEKLPVFRLGHLTPFEDSLVWYVPTRRPEELRTALVQHAGFFDGQSDPSLPTYLRFLFERAGLPRT